MSIFRKRVIAREPTNFYIFLTYIIAIISTLIINSWLDYFPNFLLLVLTWWSLRKPQFASMFLTFFLGIFYDIVCDRIMGVGVIEFILVIYITYLIRYRFLNYHFLQQTVIIIILYFFAFALPFNFANIFTNQPQYYSDYAGGLISGLIWFPFVLVIIAPQYRPIKDANGVHQNVGN